MTVMTRFTLVEAPSSYNVIFGRPAMNAFRVVASAYHQKIKFPVGDKVGEVRGDQPSSRKFYAETVKVDYKRARQTGKEGGQGGREVCSVEESKGDYEEVELVFGQEGKSVKIARDSETNLAEQLKSCLIRNKDVFAWSQDNLMEVPSHVAEHKLNITPGSRPVLQKKRHFEPVKDKVIAEQDQELLRAGHIKEVQFPTWLSNVVLVPKATGLSSNSFSLRGSGQSQLCHVGRGHVSKDDGQSIPKVNESECGGEMPSPTSIKEVQRLTGLIIALTRFIARSAHRSYHFFQVLRKAQSFGWTEQCEQTFQELKGHLASLPFLVKPEPRERLWIYLSTTEQAVSTILIKEEKGDQRHVYYVSHALKGAEVRYTEIEKMALALVITARKLRPYFLSHPVTILTNSLLGRVMTHLDASGRLVKWTVELGEYDIEYQTHGASSVGGSGVGVILVSPTQEKIKIAVKLDFQASNNEAEYEAVIAGMKQARKVGASHIIIYYDSQLVAQQVKKTLCTREEFDKVLQDN
ncbi:uncharacterized protein [Henckelia pumila]|uniref:uncharacterized protein n=1 Tax=Henckelia pumila TaxID=405737 RepID=UPI003C6E134B